MRRCCGCTLVFWHTLLDGIAQCFWFTAYLTSEKSGLAQERFSCVCESCQFPITRENLAVDKFVNDLVKDPKNLDDVGKFGDAVYLP